MTKDEAINRLFLMKVKAVSTLDDHALELAIEALKEHMSCEDCKWYKDRPHGICTNCGHSYYDNYEPKEKEMTIAEAVHTLRMRLPVGYSQTEEAAHYVVKEIVEERAIALDNKDISRFCDDFCRYPREYDEEKEGEYMTEKVCSTCPLGRL